MDQQEKKKKSIPKLTNFGKNLRFLRLLNALSQQELAIAIGKNRNNIASYESGAAEPNAEVFLRICNYFNKAPAQMLDTLMVGLKVEVSKLVLPAIEDGKQEEFEETLKNFMLHTFEITKMYEGYTSLVELKNNDREDLISTELYSSFSDLLDLLQSLISLNWDLMHRFVPSSITEENRTKA